MTSPFFTYRAKLEEVIDGDTLDFVIDQGFGNHFHCRVRLVRVDTHEVYGVDHDSSEYERGMEESRFVAEWMRMAADGYDGEWPYVVATVRDRSGKFGRYLGEVYRRDGRRCLNDVLLEEFNGVAN